MLGLATALIAGCAQTKFEYSQTGVSDSQRIKDIETCWRYVDSEEGQQAVQLARVARVVGGGIYAVAMDNAEASKKGYNPKRDFLSKQIHSECMYKKGYSVS